MNGREPRLTREQLEAWASYQRAAWGPFKAAWIGRGFLWPPTGSSEDEDGQSLRSLLWQVADARPNDLGRWVREAKGRTPRDVVAHVLERWHALRAEVGVDEDEAIAARERRDPHALQPLRELLEGMR